MQRHLHVLITTVALCFTIANISSGAELWLNPNRTTFNKKTGDNFLIQCKLYDSFNVGKGVPPEESTVTKQPSWTFKPASGKTGEVQVAMHARTKQAKEINYYTSNLLVTASETEDAGVYKCSAVVDSVTLERQIVLELYESVNFTNAPSIQHPIEGTTARINCSVSGSPKPEVIWFKKKAQGDNNEIEVTIESAYFPRHSFEEGGQVLVITNFNTEQDNGNYKCQVNQFESADLREKNISVIGYVMPKIKYTSPEEERQINEGSNGRVKCSAIGVPPPKYSWYKGTVELKEGEKFRFPEPGLLEIDSTDADDAGQFICKAHNEVGVSEANVTITIFLKPVIHQNLLSTKTVAQNERVEIQCMYEGGEPLESNWISPSGTGKISPLPIIDSSGMEDIITSSTAEPTNIYTVHEEGTNSITLHIVKADLRDAGEYQCSVENKAGTTLFAVAVQVEHIPQFVGSSDKNVRAIDNYTADLFCEAQAVPDPVWRWTKDGSEIYNSDDFIITSSSGGKQKTFKSTLNVKAKNNYGKYTCIASNKRGDDKREMDLIQIEIADKPKFEFDDNFPTKARVLINNYAAGSADLMEKKRPTKVELKYQKKNADAGDEPIVWDEVPSPIVYDYDTTGKYDVTRLHANTEYYIAAKGTNEAGSSEWEQAEYKTAIAAAPSSPVFVTKNFTECGSSSCIVTWNQHEDNGGSPVDEFKVEYELYKVSTDSEGLTAETSDTRKEQTLPASDNPQLEMKDLKPKLTYVIRLWAHNVVGLSKNPSILYIKREQSSWEEKEEEQLIDYSVSASSTKRLITDETTSAATATTTEPVYETYDKHDNVTEDNVDDELIVSSTRVVDELIVTSTVVIAVDDYDVVSVKVDNPDEEFVVNSTSESSLFHYNETREFDIGEVATAGVNTGAIVAIVIIVVLIIVLLVDVACYYVNQCGLLMCICVNCCGKTPPEVKAKEVAMEEGKLTPDDKRPLRDLEKEHDGKSGDHDEATPMIDKEKYKHHDSSV